MSRDDQNRALAEVLVFELAEGARVSRLSDRALVREILNTNAPDHPCVVEVLNRFLPGWENLDWE